MENNKKLRLLKIILLVLSISLIAFGAYKVFESKSYDKEKKDEKKEPYVPNKVVTDDFSYSFLKLETKNKNMIYSPLSIKYALSMLKEGAANDTKVELDNLLKDISLTKYQNIDKKLSLANALFIKNEFKDNVLTSYIDKLKEKYDAEIKYDEFKSASNINKWISDKTFNIIKNVLSDSYFSDPDLKMILINALAIDMEWLVKFDDENTYGSDFVKENDEVITVAMMHQFTKDKSFKYYQDESYDLVSLPLKKYQDTQLEFIAILPKNERLHDFIIDDNFTTNVNNLLNKMSSVKENVALSISIPRFQYDYSINVVDDLKALGVKNIFDEELADFSDMSNKPMYVSEILHKADIKFSERGVKAAAVTVILTSETTAIQDEVDIKTLKFDKPFMYLIRDSKTNEVWFIGTVYEPVMWDEVKDEYKEVY